MGSPAELLISEMRTKLDGQLATLESARTRAAVALSVSGVIAGLFAQHLIHPVGNWGLAALCAFVLGGAPALWILGPHDMTLSPKADDWIRFATQNDTWVRGQASQEIPDPEATAELGTAELALQMVPSMNEWYGKNAPMLKRIHWCLALAFLAVIVQLICWAGATLS
jgi:hypothetical protein